MVPGGAAAVAFTRVHQFILSVARSIAAAIARPNIPFESSVYDVEGHPPLIQFVK